MTKSSRIYWKFNTLGNTFFPLLFRLSTDITERSVVNFYPVDSAEDLELQDSALKYVDLFITMYFTFLH